MIKILTDLIAMKNEHVRLSPSRGVIASKQALQGIGLGIA